MDRAPLLARRIGFVSLPLACLVIRVVAQVITTIFDPDDESELIGELSGTPTEDVVGTWKIPSKLVKWFNGPLDAEKTHFKTLLVTYWIMVIFCIFMFGLVLKVLLGMYLKRIAREQMKEMGLDVKIIPEKIFTPDASPRKKGPLQKQDSLIEAKLDNIERFTMVKSRIV